MDAIEIPIDYIPHYYKKNYDFILMLQSVDTTKILEMLHTMDFLAVEKIPLFFYKYIFDLKKEQVENYFSENHWIRNEILSILDWWHLDTLSKNIDSARNGNLDRLVYTFQNNQCKMRPILFRNAIQHLHIMKWLKEHDCPWDSLVIYEACKHGNLENMKWLVENGCPYESTSLLKAAILHGNKENIYWVYNLDENLELSEEILLSAIRRGDLEIIKWLSCLHFDYSTYWIFYEVASIGSKEIMKFFEGLHPNEYNVYTMFTIAIQSGNIEITEYLLKEKNLKLRASYCLIAVQFEQLKMLKWLKNNACKWEKSRCLQLAKNIGNLEMIEWITDFTSKDLTLLSNHTVTQLKQLCKEKKLKVTGNKKELLQRLLKN